MQKENIHIVFGRIKANILYESSEFELGNSHIISLDDDLSIGPVCDINANMKVQTRKDWLQKNLGDISYFDVMLNSIEQDIENLKTIVKQSETYDKIFLWTGHLASEIVSTARLLYHLSKINKNIFIADYPNIPVKSINGDIIYPKALVATASFQINDIWKNFKMVDQKELLEWKNLWEKINLGNGQLRILNEKVRISEVDITFFDSFLVSNCNENFQKAARVIGHTLVDIDFAVNDNYLNWRLKQLALEDKIKSLGKLIEIRDYEVRKISTAN